MVDKPRAVRLAVHLPLVHRCDQDWQAMAPVRGGRACGACERVVHDLSAMTERAAARFMAARRAEKACLRYVARADGTIEYRPEPASRLAPALMLAALAGCAPHEPPPRIAGEPEVIARELPVSAAVVVPAALPAAPHDDVEPCTPTAVEVPADAKKPNKRAAPAKRVQYLGIEG